MKPFDGARLDGVALINYVTRIHFGFGAVRELGAELARIGVRRPLLVTDRGVVAAGLAAAVAPETLWAARFDGTPSNPTEQAVAAAVALYRDADCDGIVAVGGGSPIDLAKAVAVSVTHAGPLVDYALVNGGLDRITARVPAVIAVPTTAGTGSEVARATVVIMADGVKRVIASPHLVPRAAICDPALTMGLPPGLTAATGFDAIAHCIETFSSPTVNPPADAIALDGLLRAMRHIEEATVDGASRAARWHMLMASLEGGMTFQKGLGAVHALSHPLGELGLHHGTLNAVLLPPVLRHNRPWIPDKLAHIEGALRLGAAVRIEAAIEGLMEKLRLPLRLGEMGVAQQQCAPVAAKAVKDTCSATNPAPMTTADYERVLAAAL